MKGSEGKPGLAVLAMAEIISIAEESSKLITVSCYEILKDHAYDHLAPDRHEVLVLEDVARGKIQLKGLSQASYISYFILKMKISLVMFSLPFGLLMDLFLFVGSCKIY